MQEEQKKYNKIIIVTAPSGSGKTSIVKYLLKAFPQLAFSISAATRNPRKGEKNGVDYHFIDTESFKKMIHQKEFLEWEMVYEGKYYGTPKSELTRIWGKGKVPVLDLDVKGTIHVQKQYPVNTYAIFIQAPSLKVLTERLQRRGSETPESLRTRIDKSRYEMTFRKNFENIIINDDLKKACKEAEDMVRAFLLS